MQKASLLCDRDLNFFFSNDLKKKEVGRLSFFTEAELRDMDEVKAEKRSIWNGCIVPFLRKDPKSGKEACDNLWIRLDKFISIDLKWRFQTGSDVRDVIDAGRAYGPVSEIIPEELKTKGFFDKKIEKTISLEPCSFSNKLTAIHIILPIMAKTSCEELSSRLFADIYFGHDHESLDKEAYFYLGVWSSRSMFWEELTPVKELKDRVVVWKDGASFSWTQGSSKATKEDFSVGKAHLNEGVRVILLFLVKNSQKPEPVFHETSKKPKPSITHDGWQTHPLELSDDEGAACRPTFLREPKRPPVEIERLPTGDTYRIKEGIVLLNQVVAIDRTKTVTEDSFALIDELCKNFESNMKEEEGQKQ